jgi:hypothetical protein
VDFKLRKVKFLKSKTPLLNLNIKFLLILHHFTARYIMSNNLKLCNTTKQIKGVSCIVISLAVAWNWWPILLNKKWHFQFCQIYPKKIENIRIPNLCDFFHEIECSTIKNFYVKLVINNFVIFRWGGYMSRQLCRQTYCRLT